MDLLRHKTDPDELLSAKESVTEAKLAKIGADAGAVLFSARETPSSSSSLLSDHIYPTKGRENDQEETDDQEEERFLSARVGDDDATRISPKKRLACRMTLYHPSSSPFFTTIPDMDGKVTQTKKGRKSAKKSVVIDKEVEYDHIGTDIKSMARDMKLP
uniref:Uncharacterized protein n=1 Tax=Romanomermis culicivorax TaxID=13658 RepID=A0A915I197_ROMCU